LIELEKTDKEAYDRRVKGTVEEQLRGKKG
jgi:hypothetical protein